MRTPIIPLLFTFLLSFPVVLKGQRSMPGSGVAPVPVGSEIPDVSAVTAEGKAYSLRENLQGKTAVLVFGCLT